MPDISIRSSDEDQMYERWGLSRKNTAVWRETAWDDYRFVDGFTQWTDDDLSVMKEQKRPAITFNYSSKMVDVVVGTYINNRNVVRYYPRGTEDASFAEVNSQIIRWISDNGEASEEETQAFRDAVICGLGWVESSMDYEEDLDGKVVYNRRSPLKMWWDYTSDKPNLTSSKYIFFADFMSEEDVRHQWPDKIDEVQAGGSADNRGGFDSNADAPDQYASSVFNFKDYDMEGGQYYVKQYQTFKKEPWYRFVDPKTGEMVDADEKRYNELKKVFPEINGVKQFKKVYYRAYFIGETVLEFKKSPNQSGFTFQPITGKFDEIAYSWYGLARSLKDPQRWANKWLSQILHLVNTNIRGGAFIEENAIKDPRRAEEQWNSPNALILLEEGGINKIRERTDGAYPSGIDRLMQFAFNAMPQVVGINMETLGLADREQANVLEQTRKRAALVVLARIFDSMKRYHKKQSKVVMDYVRNFIPIGSLERAVEPEYKGLILQAITGDVMKYDIVVDEALDSPDMKSSTWQMLSNILPTMIKSGVPIPPEIYDYVPLPPKLAQKFKDIHVKSQQPQVPPEVQQQMQRLQEGLQKLQEENQTLKSNQQTQSLKIQGDQAVALEEIKIDRSKAEADSLIKRESEERKAALARDIANEELRIQREKAITDAAIKLLAQEEKIQAEKVRTLQDEANKQANSGNDFAAKVLEKFTEMQKSTNELLGKISGPRKLSIDRDKSGRPIGGTSKPI